MSGPSGCDTPPVTVLQRGGSEHRRATSGLLGRGRTGLESVRSLIDRTDALLARRIPEKRLFLKSDHETRFIRLTPLKQLGIMGAGATLVVWAIVSTAILLMDSVGSGNLREQAKRELFVYEARINALSTERDQRAQEALKAQERFNIALEKISEMQSALLASENRRREVETGIEAVQQTLRQAMRQRDDARRELAALTAQDDTATSAASGAESARDLQETMEFLVEALDRTANERDDISTIARQIRLEAEHLALERRLMEDRNQLIFTRLEDAVSTAIQPMERLFRDAGLQPQQLLDQVRSGMARPEERLTPIAISTRGSATDPEIDPDEARVNEIIAGLDRINLYRIAARNVPFARPVSASVRMTSGFGPRRDPITGRTRAHNGVDWAGRSGTAISATSDGVVTKAGWYGGYGNTVIIRHAFGIETLYAHLSRIDVKEGQRVSRGDRIGGMGTTGRSTGVHLHYEVRVGGNPVNPMTYIRAARNVF